MWSGLGVRASLSTVTRPRIIAIDGPVAAGKTTVGRLLSRRTGYPFVDTGAMYRAITWLALESKADLNSEEALTELAARMRMELKPDARRPDGSALLVNGRDISDKLRLPEVEQAVSIVSRVLGVRRALVRLQQQLANSGGVIMAGRDIGTVVLPDADLKVFLVASPEERARRRYEELCQIGQKVSYEAILLDMQRRDKLDSERPLSPLRPAPDARLLDTDGLTLEQVVEKIYGMIVALGCTPSVPHPHSS